MSFLRIAVIGFLCVCYVVCNIVDDIEYLNNILKSENSVGAKNCTTDDGKPGTCINKVKCDMPNNTQVDPPYKAVLRSPTSCHYLQTCCPPEKEITKAKSPQIYLPPAHCGMSNPGAQIIVRQMTDDNYAEFAEFPWMVALLDKKNKKRNGSEWSKEYVGGGSLIHQSVVITVAHTIDSYEPSEIKCRAGEWDTQTKNEVEPHQERNVKKIVIHDEYSRFYVHYDVALLILSEPFELAPHIGIACLGSIVPSPGTKCYSMGWGAEFNQIDKYAVLLKKIRLPLVERRQCENNLKNSDLGQSFFIHSSHLCAGGEEGIDTCVGDGGSPLVCAINNPTQERARYAVFGMVSFGATKGKCGVKNEPGIYTNIPHLYQWVTQKMTMEGFPSSQFENKIF